MNMKNIKIKMNKHEKGQTLLFVIVAVTIAMAVGVAVSTRTIQSLKRVARTDTSARVIAAAEGGIENLLSKNYSQLDDVATDVKCESIGAIAGLEEGTCVYAFDGQGSKNGSQICTCTCNYCASESERCSDVKGISIDKSIENQPEVKAMSDPIPEDPGDIKPVTDCPSGISCSFDISCDDKDEVELCTNRGGTLVPSCQVNKETTTGDLISSRAVVKVEKFSTNEGSGYSFNLNPGSLKEVNLDNYESDKIKICWENSQTAIYYLSYNKDGDIFKGGIKPRILVSTNMNLSDIFENDTESEAGYSSCKKVSLAEDPYGLRIKVLYNTSKVAVFPTDADVPLPTQGYKLTSRGEVVTGSGSEEKATVIVHKSYPYAPDIFDYGIYTPTTLSGSN